MAKKEQVYKRIRQIAIEQDCDEAFLNNFDACYSIMYDAIYDLSVMKQIFITVKAMTVSVQSVTVQLERFNKILLTRKIC